MDMWTVLTRDGRIIARSRVYCVAASFMNGSTILVRNGIEV